MFTAVYIVNHDRKYYNKTKNNPFQTAAFVSSCIVTLATGINYYTKYHNANQEYKHAAGLLIALKELNLKNKNELLQKDVSNKAKKTTSLMKEIGTHAGITVKKGTNNNNVTLSFICLNGVVPVKTPNNFNSASIFPNITGKEKKNNIAFNGCSQDDLHSFKRKYKEVKNNTSWLSNFFTKLFHYPCKYKIYSIFIDLWNELNKTKIKYYDKNSAFKKTSPKE